MLRYLVLVASSLIFSVFAGKTSDLIVEHNVDPSLVDYKNATSVILKNITIREIPKHYFQNLKVDLSFLGITDSKLVRIDEEAFDSLNHLNLLELSRDEITEIKPNTFTPLKGLELLQLKCNKLRNISLILSNVQEIVLMDNEIEYLQEDFIRGSSVTFIDLRRNRLTNLSNPMRSLTKLATINIANNRISNIEPEVFSANENLVTIDASGNCLTSTKGLKLKQLVNLDLSSNYIRTLDNDSLSGMAFLNNLLLKNNQIAEIHNAFADLKNLQFLDLSNNRISFISPDLFINNQYLFKLRLSNNRIASLEPFCGRLSHLAVLDLSHNGLASIGNGFFKFTDRLETLDLGFNNLKAIDGLLDPLTELVTLDLSHNQIAFNKNTTGLNVNLKKLNLSSNGLELSVSDFDKNRKLTQLDLSRNKIRDFCDVEFDFEYLMFIDLSQNRIKELNCLKKNSFLPFSFINIRQNPLICDSDMDDVISHFVQMHTSPYGVGALNSENFPRDYQDVATILGAWNSIKRELCPDGLDIHIEMVLGKKEDENEDSQQDYEKSYFDYDVLTTPDSKDAVNVESAKIVEKKLELDVEVEVESEDINVAENQLAQQEQSEGGSWDMINEVGNVAEEYEDRKAYAYEITENPSILFTISLIFIGISVLLVLLNVAFCMCVRLKGWRRDMRNSQKYTHLENRVYKNTTVPNDYINVTTRNPEGNYGINCAKVFKHFGFKRKDDDAESVKKMIVDSGLKTDV